MTDTQNARFITLEGSEGLGKSTASAYIQELLTQHQIDFIATREPGGTTIAEAIRDVLLSDYDEQMATDTELLLMFASRAQHIANVIQPALVANKWVLCDRFTDASYAYQGGGHAIPEARIGILEDWVQQGLQPDITILLDAPVELTLQRLQERKSLDRIEQQQADFFQRVRDAYLQRAEQYPNRYHVIDASQSLLAVQQQLSTIITKAIG